MKTGCGNNSTTMGSSAKRLAKLGALCAGLGALAVAAAPSEATAQVCARVKIEIVQELTLERQAFDAKMKITNGLQNLSIENIGIEVVFEDAQGNPVEASSDPNNETASFFITLDSLEGINAVDGTGTIAPETAGEIHWLIIPAPGAAGPAEDGTLYFVGAKVTYSIGGDTREVEVVPDSIYVKPMPMLYLDYFLPEQVHSDNPYTLEVEPPVPFTLGVRVANRGFGPARNLKINSSQPKIVENELGLLIAFEIIGSEVNGSEATPSLLVDFGTIDSGSAGLARWFMTSTLQGKFIEFTATFSHADELGGLLTSLLEEVNTHKLIRDVLVEVEGRDSITDFLAQDPDKIRVYESDKVEEDASSVVFDASSTAAVQPVGGHVYDVTVGASAGFSYVRVTDPLSSSKVISSVVRADGRVIHPQNAWLSREWVKQSQSYLYYLNIFDHNNTGGLKYTVTYGGANVGNLAPVLGPTPDRNVRVGETLTYTVQATDPNGSTPSLQAAPLPMGATFTDLGNGGGVLSWTPVASAIGSYPVDFAAYDGALFDTATAIIQVVPADAQNSPPTSTSASLGASKNQASAPVTPTVADPDPNDKHFFATLTAPAHGEAFVENNKLVYVPEEDYVGLDSFQYQAMDLFGEVVTGTASVVVTDGDNLIALGIELVESGGAVTAVQVSVDTVGTIANIVPIGVRLEARSCTTTTVLGSVSQTLGSGPSTLVFPVDLSSFGSAPIALVAIVDTANALPETSEFDNVAVRGLRTGSAGPLTLSLESSGAAPETICDGQVLTATGRSYLILHEAGGTCIGPFAGAAQVDYELTNLSTGVVVRDGTVWADSNGAWTLEFGLPQAPNTTYELVTYATDGEQLNTMVRTLTTVSGCVASIPPPMVPTPAFPGPDGDVPNVRFSDGIAKLPWVVHPGMAIPTSGLTGSGTFGHTRGTGSSANGAPNGPALGSTGGVAQEVQTVEGQQVVVSTFDASVDDADFVMTPPEPMVGQPMTLRGLVQANDSYYGLPVQWSVTEPGGSPMPIAPPTWMYANGPLAVIATWTPRVDGDHAFALELTPDFADTDDSNDGSSSTTGVTPDTNATMPTLTAIAPNQALLDTAVTVAITGTKFTSGIVFDCGDGVVISDVSVLLDDATFGTSATALFTVEANAIPGLRTCTATTSNGTATLVGAFWVLETLCDNVTCADPPTVCHAATGTCNLGDGSCTYAPLPAGTACDDGYACTTGAECNGTGVCGSANWKDCNDGIPCTIDTCDSASGCLNVPGGAGCDPDACLMGGDVNGSASLNVADVMCMILVVLGGPGAPAPACLAGPVSLTDINCNGSTSVADVQLGIFVVLGLEFAPSVDRNANSCSDACEKLDCPDTTCEPSDEWCLLCDAQCGACTGSCCAAHPTAGCDNVTVQECVCDTKPECCSVLTGWTAQCVALANGCGATCGP